MCISFYFLYNQSLALSSSLDRFWFVIQLTLTEKKKIPHLPEEINFVFIKENSSSVVDMYIM